jgi:hypothetical protein
METPSIQGTVPATSNSSYHGTGQDTRSWLGGRRGLIIAGAVAAVAAAFALGQHWLAAADLVALLFIVPCVAMIFMMHGSHGQPTNAPPASTQGGTPSATDTQS